MPLFGMMHSVEDGAARYVEGVLNPKFRSGHFYASKMGSPTGSLVDQATIDDRFSNQTLQDNAYQAVRNFI